jgi:methylmalonyl-CoA/ethylmalonyl-CoA epimerase
VTPIRRLDHVAVLVRSTEDALAYFSGHLGLEVAHQDQLSAPPVRLTYLDCGNAWIQLVEPLDPEHPLARHLAEHGEGLHHICFGVDDVPTAVSTLSDDGAVPPLGSGRGRRSGFVATRHSHGVRIECTEFVREQDVDRVTGWLPPAR